MRPLPTCSPFAPPTMHCRPTGPSMRSNISRSDYLLNIIEKISAIALGAFSFYTSSKLFLPSFFIGCVIGIYCYIEDANSCDQLHRVSSCANGLLEQLTGVKLPKIVSIVTNVAVTVCHIDHHSSVFVPVVGISIGAWCGKTALDYGVPIFKKINNHLQPRLVAFN